MKITKFSNSVYLYKSPYNSSIIYCSGSNSGNFIISNNKILFEEFSDDLQLFKFYKLGGEYYRRSFRDESLLYTSHNGDDLSLPACVLDAIFPYYQEGQCNPFLACFLYDYPCEFDITFALFNFEDNSIKESDLHLFLPVMLNENIYGVIEKNGTVFKLNLELNYKWKYEFDSKHYSGLRPLIFESLAIVFSGYEKKSRQLIDGIGHEICSGGKIIALNDHDGSLIWEREIPNGVDNYQLFDRTLYVAALNEILLIDPETGKLLGQIDTKTSTPINRSSLGLSIYVDKNYIYYSHYDDQCLLIYDRSNLALRRRIDLPERCHIQEHQFFDENTGKHYFTLADRNRYVAQSPILELDPSNIDAPLEFETEPKHCIELQASADTDNEKELLIRLSSSSLDDALRFGEIYTRDEAQRYSYNYINKTFQERPFTPEENFNGVIQFEYSGCDQTADVVEQHLRIMEKRFEKWVKEEGFFSCVDKNQLTQLKAVYIDY